MTTLFLLNVSLLERFDGEGDGPHLPDFPLSHPQHGLVHLGSLLAGLAAQAPRDVAGIERYHTRLRSKCWISGSHEIATVVSTSGLKDFIFISRELYADAFGKELVSNNLELAVLLQKTDDSQK